MTAIIVAIRNLVKRLKSQTRHLDPHIFTATLFVRLNKFTLFISVSQTSLLAEPLLANVNPQSLFT